jgi:hypothetical protein
VDDAASTSLIATVENITRLTAHNAIVADNIGSQP